MRDRSMGEAVAVACQQTKDLHNEIISIANAMAIAEVEATDTDRAVILAEGFNAMIDATEVGVLPTAPALLVDGLSDRRSTVVAEMRVVADEFAATQTSVNADQRAGVVTQIFVRGEKLMSETEPRLGATAEDELIAAVALEPACQNVVQLR